MVANHRIAQADSAAQRLVAKAVAKAKQMRMHARNQALLQLKQGRVKAAEMKEDTRSELASDHRKERKAEAENEAARIRFESAESSAWRAMEIAEHESQASSQLAQQQKLAKSAAS